MKKQKQERYVRCEDTKMNAAGKIVRNLLAIDLERPYNKRQFNISERSTYAGNIYHAIREYRSLCNNDSSCDKLLSGILGVDINDLEIKVFGISQGISEGEAKAILLDEGQLNL